MARHCSECTYLKVSGEDNYGKFWCEYKNEWMYANAIECYRFCTAYNRPSQISRSAFEYSESKQNSSGCYITTALCDILKMPDNNPYLQTLRIFRKEILQKNPQYFSILIHYDLIGPMIAKNMMREEKKEAIAYQLLENFIKPVVLLVQNKKTKEAVDLYVLMTNELAARYQIPTIWITQDVVDQADIAKSGHGHYQKKLI